MRYAMIMAGGRGTRLWPMSRKQRPKQMLPLVDGRSLLELAGRRLEGVVPAEQRLICTSEAHRHPLRESLPQFSDEQILGEPVGRDTVNAIGFTAAVLAKRDPEAVFAVLTADHIIEPQDEFRRKVNLGFQIVEEDRTRFATFSIMPTYAATAYGYVERSDPVAGFQSAYIARRFVEKPDAKTAQSYIDAGTFGWNSGMFVFSAREFLAALRKFKPRSYEGIARIGEAWDTLRPEQAVLNEVYRNAAQDQRRLRDHGARGQRRRVHRLHDHHGCVVDGRGQLAELRRDAHRGRARQPLQRQDVAPRLAGRRGHLR